MNLIADTYLGAGDGAVFYQTEYTSNENNTTSMIYLSTTSLRKTKESEMEFDYAKSYPLSSSPT